MGVLGICGLFCCVDMQDGLFVRRNVDIVAGTGDMKICFGRNR